MPERPQPLADPRRCNAIKTTNVGANAALDAERGQRLYPAVDLAQTAPLVERAAELSDHAVRVGMDDGGVRQERLGVAGAQHVEREGLVLPVRDRPEWHPLPGPASHRAVGVREECLGARAARRRRAVEPRLAI